MASSPELSTEDGTLPWFTGPSYHSLNNILIVRVPDESRKPGEPRYQLATNPLCEQKVMSDFPATNLLRSMLPKSPEKPCENSESFPESLGPGLNSSLEKEENNVDVNVRKVPPSQIPKRIQNQRPIHQGRSELPLRTALNRNSGANSDLSPWANNRIAFCMQNNLPFQKPPTPGVQRHPYPNPNCEIRPPFLNTHPPIRFPPPEKKFPSPYSRMQEPCAERPFQQSHFEQNQNRNYSYHRGSPNRYLYRNNFRGRNGPNNWPNGPNNWPNGPNNWPNEPYHNRPYNF